MSIADWRTYVLWITVATGLFAVRLYLRRPSRKPLDLVWGWFTPAAIHRVCTRCGRPGRRAEPADLADALTRRPLPPHVCKGCVKKIRAGGSPRRGAVTRVAEGRDPA